MTNAIYISTIEAYSGKSVIALGVVNLLVGKTAKIAFFKPIISSEGGEKDPHIDTIASHFNLEMAYEDMFVFTRNEVLRYINAGKEAYIIDTIIQRFKHLQERYDFVVVEGVGGWMVPITARYFSNDLAVDLRLPAIVVAENRLGCLNHIMLTVRAIESAGLKCAGVVLNDLAKESDLAMTTNAEILRSCLTLPILAGFDPAKAELDRRLRQMLPEFHLL